LVVEIIAKFSAL